MPSTMVPTCEIRIELDRVSPPIWRTVLVRADIGLDVLHCVIQAVMGWSNAHPHEFRKGKECYGVPDPDGDFNEDLNDEGEFCIAELLQRPKQKITYEYDFGDGWSHTVTLLRIIPEPCPTPRCVDGKRACPPEDCGGPGGYENLLEILADPKHADYKDMMAWHTAMTPEGHDSEVFPIAAVNERLSHGLDAPVEEYLDLEEGGDWEDDDDDQGEDGGKTIPFTSRN